MRILFYLGLALLGLAFVAAAAETASHAMPGAGRGFIVSARDLWYTFWPASLAVFEIRVTRNIGAWAWDPVLLTILSLPGWAIAGIPGGFLVWRFNPRRGQTGDDELRAVVDSFELFEELNKRAKAEQAAENRSHEEHGLRDILPDDLAGKDIAPDANRPGEFLAGDDPFDTRGDGDNR